MRDFRTIQQFERDWKESQHKLDEAKREMGQSIDTGGGGINLEELVEELAEAG